MRKEDILNLFHNCTFDGELTDYDYKEKIINKLPKEFIYNYSFGASKLVILPREENFVIKIPFTGTYMGGEYYCFSEAGLLTGNVNNEWDYCHTEEEVYNLAISHHVEDVFCKTELVGCVNFHPIYIQEFAEVLENLPITSDACANAEDSLISLLKTNKPFMKKVNNLDGNINKFWLMDVYNYFGERLFEDIVSFIDGIDDLHDGNVGYVGDRPVLVDYSGFCS